MKGLSASPTLLWGIGYHSSAYRPALTKPTCFEVTINFMRCLGEIRGRRDAERLVAHLLTIGISTHIEAASLERDEWELWVKDEDRLQEAVRELEQFQAAPSDPKYDAAIERAKALLQEEGARRRAAAKNIQKVKPSGRSAFAGGGRLPPLTLTLVILCILVGLVTEFSYLSEQNTWGKSLFNQLCFVTKADFAASDGNPAASLMKWELWRAITPMFLHQGAIHMAMNLVGIVILGRIIERMMGTPRYGVFILAAAVGSALLQGLVPAPFGSPNFVGISGVVYGLLGYVWIRSRLNPRFGFIIPPAFFLFAVGSIVLGLSQLIPQWPLADLCHLGGLLVGLLAGYVAEAGK